MMLNLIKNELFKILKQKGYVILAIILLLGFVVSPIITYVTTNIATQDVNNIRFDYNNALRDYNNNKDNISSKADVDNIKYFIDNLPEWKYYIYKSQRYNLLYQIELYENSNNGTVSFYGTVFNGLNTEEAESAYIRLKNELVELDNKIKNDTPYSYNLETYEKGCARLSIYEDSYKQAIENYQNNKTEKNGLLYEKAALEYEIAKKYVDAIAVQLNNNYEPYPWITNAYNIIFKNIAYLDYDYPIMTKSEYLNETTIKTVSYADYYKECMLRVDAYKEKTYEYIFCVEHNIQPSDYEITGINSLKTLIRNSYISMEGILWIVFAIMGAAIIAGEFSHGTARFLFIRPRKRSSILFSKIFSALIVYGSITILGVILQTIVTIIFFGIGDIFKPNVLYMMTSVVSVPSILSFLKLYLEKFVVMFFYMLVSIFFAILSKRTVVSILIVYGIKSGIGMIYTVLNVVKKFVHVPIWIFYSPLAFTDGIGSNGNIIDEIFNAIGLSDKISYGYIHPWLGVLYYLIACTLMLLLINRFYKKVQI